MKTTSALTTTAVSGGILLAQSTNANEAFLEHIESGNLDRMNQAWSMAPKQPVSVIASLADMTLHENPAIAKCAEECINIMVHSVGKSKSNSKRKPVADALIDLLDHESNWVKTLALRLGSLVCDGEHVPAIAKLLHDADQREEAVFALERIPDAEATEALITAYEDVFPEFRNRIVVALGHRGTEDVLPTLAKALQSGDNDLALDAMEASARIGQKPPEGRPPAYGELTDRQKRKYIDAYLRMVDVYVDRGDYDEPLRVCENILSGEGIGDEHFHSAAVVSLSGINDPRAVAMIIDALDAAPYILRITAKKQLISMDGDAVDPALKTAHDNAEGDLKAVLEEIVEARA